MQDAKDQLIGRFREETDPQKRMAIMEELALMSDSDAAFKTVMDSTRQKERKPIVRPVKGPDGGLMLHDGQQVWEQFDYDPELGSYISSGRFIKGKSGVNIQNVIQPADKAKSVYAGESAKRVSELDADIDLAREGASQMRVIADVLGDFEGGAWDAARAKLGTALPIPGLKEAATAGQFVESIRLKAANSFRMPGAVSNYEAQTYLAAVPGMIWYRDGRNAMADYARKLADRKTKLVSFRQKQLREQGWVDQDSLDAYDKSLGPIFTQEDVAKLKGFASGGIPSEAIRADHKPG